MNQTLGLLFILGHVLGDFYLQSSKLAKEKETSFKKLIIHCLWYLLAMLIVTIPVFSLPVMYAAIIIGLLHFAIDSCKFYYTRNRKLKEPQEIIIYLIDQVLHLLVITVTMIWLTLSSFEIQYISVLESLINGLGWEPQMTLAWILIVLVLIQPCSITIKKVLNHYRPRNEDYADEGLPNAGALIGVFERLFIVLMLYANQFTAIGFVLTAKSIARYNKISENPQFAEYYLLGTLLSTLLIIISYFFIF